MKEIRVAFVGAGNMTKAHARAFRDIEGVVLAGIVSRTRSKAEGLAGELGIEHVYDSIGAMHGATKADLLVVSVPELSARAVCLEAFHYPWTILAEKPVGYNLAEAEEIADAARSAGRSVYVALNRRHYGSTRAAVADLASDPARRFIQVIDQEDPERALEAGQPALVTENWMYANSIHMIDYLTFLGRGRIAAVQVISTYNPAKPDFVAAKIEYESGDVGLYESVWNGPGPWAVNVTTGSKRRELKPLEKMAVQVRGSRTLEAHPEDDWDKKFKPGLRRQAEETVRMLRGEPHQVPTISDALETMRLVHRIYGV